ncbi:hypothetical protein, partial [Bacillus thuringiensis]|uniref:hypothetical protein n=1 Tax=Bacillus thuringiensis TaxID=1428 RepID=UPI002DBA1A22
LTKNIYSTEAFGLNHIFTLYDWVKKNKTTPPHSTEGHPICSTQHKIGGALHLYRWLLYDKQELCYTAEQKKNI